MYLLSITMHWSPDVMHVRKHKRKKVKHGLLVQNQRFGILKKINLVLLNNSTQLLVPSVSDNALLGFVIQVTLYNGLEVHGQQRYNIQVS